MVLDLCVEPCKFCQFNLIWLRVILLPIADAVLMFRWMLSEIIRFLELQLSLF